MYNKVIDHFSNYISSCQYGFQQHKSTLQQLLIYFNDLITSKNKTDAIYLNISKAFDSVSHKILLNKIWSIGTIKPLWSWFQSYLTGQYQCVRINNCLSETLPVLSGVPQGSILGPLLFIIYINDLSNYAHFSNILIFADDTKCYKHITDTTDADLASQQDLESLSEWSIHNLLTFNSTCILLKFKSKSSVLSLTISIILL